MTTFRCWSAALLCFAGWISCGAQAPQPANGDPQPVPAIDAANQLAVVPVAKPVNPCGQNQPVATPPRAFCAKFDASLATLGAKSFCSAAYDLLQKTQQLKAKKADTATMNMCLKNQLNALDPTKNTADLLQGLSMTVLLNQIASTAMQAASQARPDQQLGAGNSASGTTSLVSKAGSTELISLAVDSGALTQSVNGSTATLSANADQLFRILTGHDPGCLINCPNTGGLAKLENGVLNNLNVTASFALAQTGNATTPTSGQASGTPSSGSSSVTMTSIPTGAGKLSSITAKYQILDKYDPHSTAFQTKWLSNVSPVNSSVVQASTDIEAVRELLAKDSTFSGYTVGQFESNDRKALLDAANQDSSGDTLVKTFEAIWTSTTATASKDAALPAAIAKVNQDRQVFRTAWYDAIAQTAGTLFTLQYTFNKPLNQPQTHDFTGVLGYSGSLGMITANGAASVYGTLPPGANYGRIHYGQVSVEYDRNLAGPASSIQPQLSLAGYWQYQPQPSVLNIAAGTVAPGTNIPLPNGTQEFVGTAGSLWVTQAKLIIKGTGGVSVPIGVSWSNKTDLLQGNKVGAQVGISYDFSSLKNIF